jgi:maltose O-acetyltransferase
MRSEKDKMLAGELYHPADPELQAASAATLAWLATYNASLGTSPDARHRLLAQWLGTVGEGVVVRPPFFCDYGFNIRIGKDSFVNFNCIILDICEVTIGEAAQIGPAVQIYAADHPRDPAQRRAGLELGMPVRIGDNVWIGGGAIILPGVTIGDDAIIGAGSVVNRNVPAGATAVGNPARPTKG